MFQSVMLDDLKFQAKKVRIVKTKANNLRPETKDTNVDTNCLPPSPTKNDAMLKVI